MKPLLDVILILAWLSAYLGVVYVAGQYRRARALRPRDRRTGRVSGPKKTLGVWLATLVTGILLGAAAFFVTRVFGALP